MQGQNLLRRLARILKRLGIGLALPMIIVFLTVLLVNPSRIVELTTNIANLSVVIRLLLVVGLYGVIGVALYLDGSLPVIDRLRRNRKKANIDQKEQPALVQVTTQAENEEPKKDSLLGRALRSSTNRVVKEVANRTLAPKEGEIKSSVKLAKHTESVSDDMNEDDFYTYLQTIQSPESQDDETSASSH